MSGYPECGFVQNACVSSWRNRGKIEMRKRRKTNKRESKTNRDRQASRHMKDGQRERERERHTM